MTTLRETAINKPLSGLELKQIIERDFATRLLPNEGSLSNHIAYGRVAYQIVLRLFTANPMMPATEISISSAAPSISQVIGVRDDSGGYIIEPHPELTAIEPPPLRDVRDSDEPSIGGTTLQRTVTSPNSERVREGLPVPVEVRQQDGTKTVERILYPRVTGMGDSDVTIADSTADAKAAFGR
jgi:hypothetical protein